jgi:serine/threonine protein kinase
MSVSMNDDRGGEADNARGDLATWLDNYTAGRCDRGQMQASFLEICRSNPEAPWDALALLDQYQRRGRIDATLARSLKSDIAQLVFGVVNQTEEDQVADRVDEQATDPDTEDTPPASDTTGTRWRKLMAEREAARSRESFVDPVQFSRDIDPPVTRPPPRPRPAPLQRAAPAKEPGPGSVLRERYELQTILGRGRTGTVYKALDRHRSHLDLSSRYVAVRVLNPNYRDSPQALAELEREFHQAQSLSHPNIVSVFDLDRDGGTYFLVMEVLEGELLSDVLLRLDQKPMPREQALAIVGSIGAALAHAHRRGVVHSDLKPGNVIVTVSGEVKVLDFGFVRREAAEPRRGEPWIGDPAHGGSPSVTLGYASEERGNAEPAGESEDVYSLGCIAYELLAGQHPFGGRSASLAKASGRSPQRIRGLNNRQWAVLQTALQWSRAERRIDVVELISGLGCTQVRQQLTPPQEIMGVETPRGSGVAVAASVLALLLLAGAAAMWQGWLPTPPIVTQLLHGPVAPGTVSAPAPTSTVQIPQDTTAPPPPVAEPVPKTTPPSSTTPPPVTAAPKQPAGAPPAASAASPDPTIKSGKAAGALASATTAGVGPSVVAFDKDTYVATESEGVVKLTVKRAGSTRHAARFEWTLIPNSAAAGDDFAAIGPGMETIAAGHSSATLAIPLVSDAIREPTELFLVELVAVDDSARVGDQARAAVIVVDDD